MCLALIAIGQHPLYPMIILSNRDEFYTRASLPAHFWNENPNVFSGKDLVRHGSWLGVNKNGNFALITNYRDPAAFKSSMQSRGLLVSNYLSYYTPPLPHVYLQKVKAKSNYYNQFNLIIGNIHNAYYFSNVNNEFKELSTGIYCVSNHLLDTPWYKVDRAKNLFIDKLSKLIAFIDPDKIHELLFSILTDRSFSPPSLLPKTGVSIELEKLLSSIYVDIPEYQYGTCSSSVILFENNNISFAEKIFKDGNFISYNKTNIVPIHPLLKSKLA